MFFVQNGKSAKERGEQQGIAALRRVGREQPKKEGDKCPNCRQKEGQNDHRRKEKEDRLYGRESHEIQGIHADKPIKSAEVKAPKGTNPLRVEPPKGGALFHKAKEPRRQGSHEKEGEGRQKGEGEGQSKKKPEEDGDEEPSPSGRVALKKRAK